MRVIWLLLLSACASSAPAAPAPVRGTYEVVVCRTECAAADDASILRQGFLVLHEDLGPNFATCYALTRNQDPEAEWAVWEGGGQLNMRLSPDGRLTLDIVGVDYGYRADLRPEGSGFVGQGRWYANLAEGTEFVVLRRIGPPRASACEPAAAPDALRG